MICLVWTSYCSPLVTPLFFYLVVFRRRAHGPFVHCLAVTVAVRTDHVPNIYIVVLVRYLALISTSCHYGLGKPSFVFFTYANVYLSLRASPYAFDFVSASCAPPPPTSSSPSPPPSPFVVSSPVSTTEAENRIPLSTAQSSDCDCVYSVRAPIESCRVLATRV